MGYLVGTKYARQAHHRRYARVLTAAVVLCSVQFTGWGAEALPNPVLTLDPVATQPASEGSQGASPDLTSLSLEDLLNIQVTSVSKQKQRLGDAAAAVFVITQDDIHRSGMTNIAELLRLAPGLDVAQTTAGQWAVGARGPNSVRNNNLLVLMDGRTVYTPLFSGVYWDQVDYVLADLDRIEVVRGPGATLWGANAVNGVINIVSKNAKDTQGLLVDSYGGADGYIQSVRYGGNIDNRVFYRVYGKYRSMDDSPSPSDLSLYDGWDSQRGGFRVDANLTEKDLLTIQSDVYQNRGSRPEFAASLTPPFERDLPMITDTEGQNVLGRWTHTFSEDSDLMVQAYYDRLNWSEIQNDDTQQTFDLEFQHRFPLFGFNEIIWGGGYRLVTDDVRSLTTGFNEVIFDPSRRDNSWINGFVQDDITLFPKRLHVIVGTKVEEVPYTNLEIEPSARILFTPDDKNTLWASVSRAIRSPARWEEDLHGVAQVTPAPPPNPFPVEADVNGNRRLNSEQLTALEAGYRVEPAKNLSFDISGFYNFYHGIVGEVATGAPNFIPVPTPHLALGLEPSNQGDGASYGAEIAAQWKVRDNWRLQGSYSFLQTDIHSPDVVSGVEGTWNDSAPKHQFQIHSYYDITKNIELNASAWFVDELHQDTPHIGSYIRADANIVWRPEKHTELTVGFRNIFDNKHPEFFDVQRRATDTEVPRSFFISLSVRF